MSKVNQDEALEKKAFQHQLLGIDAVELYVGNARQAAHYYNTAFGFETIAYAGLETGVRDRMSYVMQQGTCFIILTSPIDSSGPIANFVHLHGDAVKDIAFRVEDVKKLFNEMVERGAQPLQEPTLYEDKDGYIIKATIAVYGDVTHSFIERKNFNGVFLPSYQKLSRSSLPGIGIQLFDHFAVSLPAGTLQEWATFYLKVFGFHRLHEEGITTEFSAMNSVAVQDSTNTIKFVLIEPRPGPKRSQIEEFLKYHQGAGVQHIALHTEDIIRTIHCLEENGIDFVSAPESYYEMLPERVGIISEDIADLRAVNVLVDRDEWGYLLQVFSLPVQSRPTLFIEIIQRKEARGFGNGNIQALFKALEREQSKRGNL